LIRPRSTPQHANWRPAAGRVPDRTVYGLGADAENPQALPASMRKGRPANHPVIVHIAPEADLGYWVAGVPQEAAS